MVDQGAQERRDETSTVCMCVCVTRLTVRLAKRAKQGGGGGSLLYNI